jgi:hypothetical protein
MWNVSMPAFAGKHFAKTSSLKSKQPPKFGMTARNPTEAEKKAIVRLDRCGNKVVADKLQNIWIIFIDTKHRILGLPGEDLQNISGLADDQFDWLCKGEQNLDGKSGWNKLI